MKLVSTTTSDGLTLNGLLSAPVQKTDTIIIHTHGMSGDFYLNSFYPDMYEKYSAHNIAFLAGENRGTHTIKEFNTESGVKYYGNAYEVFEDCVYDIQAWIDLAKSQGYKNIWLQGHSLGTSKIVYYLSNIKAAPIAGIILISPSDMIGLVHDPICQKDIQVLYPEAKELVSTGIPDQLLSHFLWEEVSLSAKTFLNFFQEPTNLAIFNYMRPDLGWQKINPISIPVLAITGTQDFGIVSVVDPFKAMEKLKSELKKSPRVRTLVFENAEHDFQGFGDQIVSEVIKFIS